MGIGVDGVAASADGDGDGDSDGAISPMWIYVLITGLAYTLQSVHHSSTLACANAYVRSKDPKVRGLVKGSAFFAMMVGIVAMSYSALRVLKVDNSSSGGSGSSRQDAASVGRMKLFFGLAAAMLVCTVFVRRLVPVDFDLGTGTGGDGLADTRSEASTPKSGAEPVEGEDKEWPESKSKPRSTDRPMAPGSADDSKLGSGIDMEIEIERSAGVAAPAQPRGMHSEMPRSGP